MKLTTKATAAARLPTDKRDHIEWDEDLAGFGLRLRASGARVRRTFIAQYRANGRTRRVLLGSALVLTFVLTAAALSASRPATRNTLDLRATSYR